MRHKMLLLGAVLFGVIAFVLTYQQLEAERRSIRGTSETVMLIRLTRDKAEGEELRQEDLARYEAQRRPGGRRHEPRHSVDGSLTRRRPPP